MAVFARHTHKPRRRRWCVALVAALLLGLVAMPASGEPSRSELARAQTLFDEGIKLFNLGRYEDACPRFEASLAVVAGVGTRGKLAECYEKLGRTASAWRLYSEVERLARLSRDELRERVARQRARALEPRLSRLTIVPGPSVTLPGFEVRANTREVEPRTFGGEQIVDPGTYVVVASAPGHQAWTDTVRVEEGQAILIQIAALQPGASDRPETGPRRLTAYGLIAAGVVTAMGGGAYFGLRARDRWELALDRHCDRATLVCDDMGLELAGEARRSATHANLSVGIGAAAITAGMILWLTSRDHGSSADAPTIGLTPMISPDSASLRAWMHF